MKIGFQMLIAIQTIPISADFRSALQDNQVYALSKIAMQVSLSPEESSRRLNYDFRDH